MRVFIQASIHLLLAALIGNAALILSVSAATIQFNVDDRDGSPLPCRIHLSNEDGRPQQAVGQPFWKDHFVCLGRVAVDVAPGKYTWTIERGPEYARADGTVDISTHDKASVNVTLKRLVSLRQRGWYSGDLHVHRPVEQIEPLMLAEDLNFATVIQWWNSRGSNLPMQGRRQFALDANHVYEILAGEDEREGGALLYFGLDRPLDLKVESREFPSPMHFVQLARQANPGVWIDIEKPFWWDVPTWLASGKMNSIGLANNHMYRVGMLDGEAWGKPRDLTRLPNPLGNGYWTQEIYYHMLNAGFRLPPSAGSASGVLPNPVGHNRVYVHLGEQSLSRQAWFDGLAAGRCFVTNGPLLVGKANDRLPGEIFQVPKDQSLEVKLDFSLTSNDPVSQLEVIHNGRVLRKIECSISPGESQDLSVRFPIAKSGWFLVRAVADLDSTFRFASTAPWYVELEHDPQHISKVSATFFLDWVKERIERVRNNVEDIGQLQAVLRPHLSALTFWQKRVRAANADLDADSSDVVESTSPSPAGLTTVNSVESQPLLASIHRLIDAMQYVGSPLAPQTVAELKKLSAADEPEAVTARVQELLDPQCLLGVTLVDGGPPLIRNGQAPRQLLEQGWRTFLVKVVNRSGNKSRLLIESPNALPVPHARADQVASRWMQFSSFEGRPLKPNLSGLELEYRIVHLYSRDSGPKSALLEFAVGSGNGEDSALIKSWRFEGGSKDWFEMNQIELANRDGSLQVTSTGVDPYMGTVVDARGGPMVLRFWAKSEVDGMGQVFWWTKALPSASGDRRVDFLLEQGKEKLYEIPFQVDGLLAGVRLDPMIQPGRMRIDWIDLYSARRTDQWAKHAMDFDCLPATKVTFRIIDSDQLPAFACFEVRDDQGRVYPAPSKRLAPDFFFQQHIYRGDGETISLPPGNYTIKCSRGPESVSETKQLTVEDTPTQLNYRVNRWVDPALLGWWSGDHHIHAAGCRHYENPTEGVEPVDMIRHIMGEDLKVGCCLTWGPCFDYQKRFFTGEVAEQSKHPYTLRYDVEVSGFGSHMSGHLNLLNLKQQIYPGGESKDHWPTLGLNTLRWAKRQGAICGPAHSAIGLTRFIGRLPNTEGKDGRHSLPHFKIPTYDGIGANEFVVDVTHRVPGPDGKLVPAVDFISTMNTDRVAEWNMWYHVLNCGFRVAASGETDFPCVTGERVGIGRVYAQVDGDLAFDKWVRSVGDGRSYVSDGLCHLLNFSAESESSGKVTPLGVDGSELQLSKPGKVKLRVIVAARIDETTDLPIEVIVNGYPVATRLVSSDGKAETLEIEANIQQSSWVAIRAFPHAHSNPIFIRVNDQPIRANADSVRWCLAGVEQCWKSKQRTYDQDEQADAKAAYEHARKVYAKLLSEFESQ